MLEHLHGWYPGDLAAAQVAHDEHRRLADTTAAAAAGTDGVAAQAVSPDCGPFSQGWYAGDLAGAHRAHAEHAQTDQAAAS